VTGAPKGNVARYQRPSDSRNCSKARWGCAPAPPDANVYRPGIGPHEGDQFIKGPQPREGWTTIVTAEAIEPRQVRNPRTGIVGSLAQERRIGDEGAER